VDVRQAALVAVCELDAAPEQLGPNIAAFLAAVGACVVSRVTDRRVLDAIVGRKDIALVMNGGTAWIEFGPMRRTIRINRPRESPFMRKPPPGSTVRCVDRRAVPA
jgi:hypothetical protein